jgi:hypothetical protein
LSQATLSSSLSNGIQCYPVLSRWCLFKHNPTR